MEIMGSPQWLEKGKCYTHVPKRPKGQPGKLQEGQPHFCPWKNHGLSPLGKHFWAYEREDSDWGTVSMNLPRVDHTWPNWSPSMIKWVDLRMRREQWMSFTTTLARLSTLSPPIFLNPSWDIMIWIGGQLDGLKPGWLVGLRECWLAGCTPLGGCLQLEYYRDLCWDL